jgi:hypothetical protein
LNAAVDEDNYELIERWETGCEGYGDGTPVMHVDWWKFE